MSKVIKTVMACPVCLGSTEKSFKKPSYFTPTILDYKCETCEGQFTVSFKPKKADSKKLEQVFQIYGFTNKTLEIIKEKHPDKLKEVKVNASNADTPEQA